MINRLGTLFRDTQKESLPAHRLGQLYSNNYIKAYLPKGERLQSGQLFFIAHDSEADANLSGIFFEAQPEASFD